MTARVVVGAEDSAAVAPLLDAYLARHPRAFRSLEAETDVDNPTVGLITGQTWQRLLAPAPGGTS